MKQLLILMAGLLLGGCLGQAQGLSDQAEVHVVTCAAGEPIYSAFGHSAFRVVDPVTRFDRVYNYGTFDFATPGFVVKFARGKLPYFLAAAPPQRFLQEYIRDRRKVEVQVLDLQPKQVQAVADYLETNMLPENREYLYDFFFDNCATRERDVLNATLGEQLAWNPWASDSLGSLRDLLDIYLAERPWADFGIDIALGLPTDQEANQQLAMFLPDYLYLGLERATIGNRPLVQETFTWVDPEVPFAAKAHWLTPDLLFWVLLGLVVMLTIFFPVTHPLLRFFDFLWFFAFGMVGMLLLAFWLGTDHQATYPNLNLLWANPLLLIFAFQRWTRNSGRQHFFARWAGLWLALVLIASLFLPQAYHSAVLPIGMIMGLRCMHVFRGTMDR